MGKLVTSYAVVALPEEGKIEAYDGNNGGLAEKIVQANGLKMDEEWGVVAIVEIISGVAGKITTVDVIKGEISEIRAYLNGKYGDFWKEGVVSV